MTHLISNFYAALHRLETVENARRGEAMKDFLKPALVMGGMLVLAVSVRVAAFVHLPSETEAATDSAPIAAAAADRGCAVRQVKMPCFQHANPEGAAMAPVPLQSGPAAAETIASQDLRCATQQVKFPCLRHKEDPRS
jgi:hypothetical protein